MTALASTGLVAGTWTIDASHTTVGFSARHLVSKVRGTFTDVAGTIVSTENPLSSSVEVTIQAGSITTGNEQRDGHLRSADFFDPTKGGTLTFVSTKISESPAGYVITGDLTINGITKSVDLAAEFFGVASDAYGRTVLGAEASTTINRHDFGVDWNMPLEGGRLLVGANVEITIALEAVAA